MFRNELIDYTLTMILIRYRISRLLFNIHHHLAYAKISSINCNYKQCASCHHSIAYNEKTLHFNIFVDAKFNLSEATCNSFEFVGGVCVCVCVFADLLPDDEAVVHFCRSHYSQSLD